MQYPPTLKDNVGFIYDGERPVGSGFHLCLTENEETIYSYLITCKHVVAERLKQGHAINLRVNKWRGTGVVKIALPDDGWIFHDDSKVDLAMVSVPIGQQENATWAAFPADDVLLTKGVSARLGLQVTEGAPVVVIGLFARSPGKGRNIPVFRSGNVALVTDEKLPGLYGDTNLHVIEAQVYPGNSGAPVYIMTIIDKRPRMFLWGVASSFFPDSPQFTDASDPKTRRMLSHSGISMAVPADRVHELLYGRRAMADRAKGIGKSRIGEPLTAVPAGMVIGDPDEKFTRPQFVSALEKVSRRVTPPSQPDESSSETSE